MIKFIRSLIYRVLTDNISFLAGGVAFYGLLAIFPAMAAIVSLFGLMANPHIVHEQMDTLRVLFPPDVFDVLQKQLMTLLTQSSRSLSFAAIISIVLAIYSATKGTKAMLAALNNVFRTTESRSWWFQQIQSYLLTFGALFLMVLAMVSVIAVPMILRILPDEIFGTLTVSLEALRWIALSAAVFFGLYILFLFGPNRPLYHTNGRCLFWGAFMATATWIATAVGGSIAIQLIPKINAAYGSFGAIIGLMLWIYLSAYIVLMGGAITATAEQFSSPDVDAECAPSA